jgi:hypothetical protein
MRALLFLALAHLTATPPDDHDQVVQLLKDSQTANLARVESGVLDYYVKYTKRDPYDLKTQMTVEMEGTYYWSEGNSFVVYKLSDPGMTARPYTAPLAQAPTEYALFRDKKAYAFAAPSHILFIAPNTGKSAPFLNYEYLALDPRTLWGNCCFPTHVGGRPWVDMIGREAPVVGVDETLELKRIGDGRFEQVRRSPRGYEIRTVFALEFAGNPIRSTFKGNGKTIGDKLEEYTWEKLPNGVVVLKECRVKLVEPSPIGMLDCDYLIQIRSIDVTSPVASSRFGLDEFKKFLPRDTTVQEVVDGDLKVYKLTPGLEPKIADSLKRLSKTLQARGFLGEKK